MVKKREITRSITIAPDHRHGSGERYTHAGMGCYATDNPSRGFCHGGRGLVGWLSISRRCKGALYSKRAARQAALFCYVQPARPLHIFLQLILKKLEWMR